MAVVEYGEPLVPLDLPEPSPAPGHAVLQVLTCGVCFSDVKTSRGEMPFSSTLSLPHVPGHEICARVVETSSQAAFAAGDVVVVHHYSPCGVCARCHAGEEALCEDLRAWVGFTDPGGFQERVVVPLDRLVRVPPGLDPVRAAPLTCALGTAYRAVVTRGGVRAGTRAAVLGLGGVGVHALQIAAAAGADAVGFDIAERPIAVARELGLRAELVRDVAEHEGSFDVAVVTASSEAAYGQAGGLVRSGGRIVAVGYALGSGFALGTPRLVLGEIEVVGSRYASREDLDRAIDLVARGVVRPIVDRVRPLEEVNEAFADLEAGRIVGRTVLAVDGG